jgi:anaerobic magnesium-protoporphyrin IX monomethyl ester cyclase
MATNMKTQESIAQNLGTRRVTKLPSAKFPDADSIVRQRAIARKQESKVDVLLVNPPSPDGGIWIRTQHRVGRRSRENMIWPQVSLAQLAALLVPDYSVEIVDAIAMRMTWKDYEALLRDRRPKYYLTQVTAPTLTNDMYGVFLAKSLGTVTMAFGTHVTPMAAETLRSFPALDFVLRGEPEMTFRELIDTLEVVKAENLPSCTTNLCGRCGKNRTLPGNQHGLLHQMSRLRAR